MNVRASNTIYAAMPSHCMCLQRRKGKGNGFFRNRRKEDE